MRQMQNFMKESCGMRNLHFHNLSIGMGQWF